MNQKLPELSKAEWAVMKVIWKLNKTNVREVCEELEESQHWAYNTVRTMMERLHEKGYVSTKKVGSMYFYRPRVSRREVAIAAFDSFSEKVFDGAVGPIVSYLIDQDKLSESELAEIRRLLKTKEE
ncbi:MAG: BlaI/MecI/CopY family transcriptional regulator [Phycisphaerales bacterium]|nr:MAG: BlaI/MecI/CopY family transcriptional regulator [Phycisphaerales bacterium]